MHEEEILKGLKYFWRGKTTSYNLSKEVNLCLLGYFLSRGSRKYLCYQSGVAHGRRQADSQPLEVAVHNVGLGNEAEGAQVSKADSSQDDVAELPTGRLDNWGVPKSSVIQYSYEGGQEQ